MKRGLILLVACASIAVLAQVAGIKVTWDGRPLTERGILVQGQLYVPASDVARVAGRTLKVETAGKAYAFVPEGGANAAAGPEGKPGETMFNGTTRLTVSAPTVEGDRLILHMEVRNAELKLKSYYLLRSESKYTLLDPQGASLDALLVSDSFVDLSPGTMRKFTVTYDLSKPFVPERIVVALHTHVPGDRPKTETFRVTFR